MWHYWLWYANKIYDIIDNDKVLQDIIDNGIIKYVTLLIMIQ